ncbi:MAG TPA: hypothetical protein VMM78_18545 [Thermomicrobiales bacterium]|nr:hypothetical protein [Thermomicrobiales bacterium]
MSNDRATDDITALLHVAGLTVSDDEARQLALFHERFAGDRARLRQIALGETEPSVTFAPESEHDEP